MISGQPSRTAFSAARHRAAHQVLEGGRFFADPIAIPILGGDAGEIARDAREHPDRRGIRLFIASRHAFVRDVIAAGLAAGVRQVVMLGAGLDTTAYQPDLAGTGVRVFEVDHPATQDWKRQQLAATGISPTVDVAYVPVDFETEEFVAKLTANGFDDRMPSVFGWLGVVPYLTTGAVWRTLSAIAALPGGASVVFDYAEPRPADSTERGDVIHRQRAARVAALGEPWRTTFEPAALATGLYDAGFAEVDDLNFTGWGHRYLGLPADVPNRPGGHLMCARAAGRRHTSGSHDS